MVGDSVLRKVVGTDSFRAVSASYLCLSCCGAFGVLRFAEMLLHSGGENFEGFFAVSMLRFFVLALDDLAGGEVCDAHGGVGCVDMLSSCALCAEGFCSQVLFFERVLYFGCLAKLILIILFLLSQKIKIRMALSFLCATQRKKRRKTI